MTNNAGTLFLFLLDLSICLSNRPRLGPARTRAKFERTLGKNIGVEENTCECGVFSQLLYAIKELGKKTVLNLL